MSRPSWDQYFLQQCELVAKRGTCPRKQVGAIVVKNKRIVATGYNGSLPGLPHCEDVGCDMDEGHCVRTIHSECNAVSQLIDERGKEFTEGCVLYCNVRPCWKCFQTIVTFSHIKKIIYSGEYREDNRISDALDLMPDYLFVRIGQNE